MRRRIADLEVATNIPEAHELLMPLFLDNTDHVTKSIRLSDLVDRIKEMVAEGSDIEITPTENGGLKFTQR